MFHLNPFAGFTVNVTFPACPARIESSDDWILNFFSSAVAEEASPRNTARDTINMVAIRKLRILFTPGG